MNDKDKRQIINNLIWAIIVSSFSYAINFITTPYIIKKLGVESYGFITLANTFTSYIDILAVALNAFAARYIAIEYHNKKYEEANSYYSSVLLANIFFVTLISIPCTLAITQLQNLLNISIEMVRDVKVLFVFVLINYCINIFSTLFSAVAFIKNQTSVTYKNKCISSVTYLIFLLISFYLFSVKVYSIALCTLASTIVFVATNYYYSRKLIPELIFSKEVISIKKVIDVVGSGIWNSLNNIGVVLNNGLDLLVTNKLLDNISLGEVSIAKQLSNIFNAVVALFVNAILPKQLEYYSKGDYNKLSLSIQSSMHISGFFTAIVMSAFCLLGRGFLNLWIPDHDTTIIFMMCIITFAGDIIQSVCRPVYYVFTLTNKLKWVCFFTITTGLWNFILMVVLIKIFNLGIYAITLSTLIAYIGFSWVNPFLAQKFLDLKHYEFIKPFVINTILIAAECLIAFIIGRYIKNNTWFSFLLSSIVVGGIITIINAFIFLKDSERKYVISAINNVIK